MRSGSVRVDMRCNKSTQNYIVHLREVAAGRHSKDGSVDAVKAGVHAKLQRARLDEIRADMLEAKLISILRGRRCMGRDHVEDQKCRALDSWAHAVRVAAYDRV